MAMAITAPAVEAAAQLVAAIIAAAFANRIALMFGSDNGGVSSGSKP